LENLVMEAAAEPVVLIAREGALLSVVCARLAMAGETPITAADCGDPRLDDGLRDRALLVVDASVLTADPEEAVAMLRAQGWHGKLVLLVSTVPAQVPPKRVAWIDGRGGTAAILSALSTLRG
jgi:hypothetical protein